MRAFMFYPIRLRVAGWLCRFAAALRGEKWYVADTWHGVPGNRAAELRQKIWIQCVAEWHADDKETLKTIDRDLSELAQAAGEAWGHVWPKEKP